ncbi:mitochondrial carrier [Auricularia subglabra TFB-10046 SS5]|uniref:Mitochondrial carrier n=1 Tax=Auricularia subglabra (strain TFB-10046 / SS5) TaxID=717982 RepID=J0LDL7_AURST|nr:mitochondrial carrier [Auricularia subglabra TFB-10046 SS5]
MREYPFYLGGVASAMAASITHPLDLTKVRMQAAHDASMLHSMATTARTAGVFGLWDGISGTLLRQLSYSLVRFAAYEDFKKRLTAASDKPPSKPQLALAGALAGAAGGLVGNPADVILVRMQGDAARPSAERYGYRNCLDGLWKIVRNEGPAARGRGKRGGERQRVESRSESVAICNAAATVANGKYERFDPRDFDLSGPRRRPIASARTQLGPTARPAYSTLMSLARPDAALPGQLIDAGPGRLPATQREDACIPQRLDQTRHPAAGPDGEREAGFSGLHPPHGLLPHADFRWRAAAARQTGVGHGRLVRQRHASASCVSPRGATTRRPPRTGITVTSDSPRGAA